MDVIFRGQHLTLDDDFRTYASDHLDKISRHLPQADHATVDVRHEAKGDDGRYVVQVTVSVNGAYLRAEERAFDLLAAVDSTVSVLDRQAKQFKEKKLLKSERRVSKEERLPHEHEKKTHLPPDSELILGRVVRMKRFPMKPMTEAEAIEQMEALGHDFFMFQDADRDTLAVLYRRRDSDYGMILPETK